MNPIHRRVAVAVNRWRRYRLLHPIRKSALQRDFESGDPARMARVQAVADRIIADLEKETK